MSDDQAMPAPTPRLGDPTWLIQCGRRGGKTKMLVEAAKEDPQAIIVCATHHEAEYLAHQYPEVRDQIVTAQASRGLLHGRRRNVYVDNTEEVLRALLGGDHIAACTFTASVPDGTRLPSRGSDSEPRVVRGYIDTPNKHGVELTFEAVVPPSRRIAHALSYSSLATLCGVAVGQGWDASPDGLPVCQRCVRAAL